MPAEHGSRRVPLSTYQPAKRHPLALTLIIAGHGAVLTALMLSKMEVPIIPDFGPTYAENIRLPDDPPPPPPPTEQPRTADKPSQVPSVIDSTPTPIPRPSDFTAPPAPPVAPPLIPFDNAPIGTTNNPPLPPAPVPTPLPPIPDPVRVEAARDPRYADAFQPPYPDSMRAQGEEGNAVVRVLIGTDGRVKAVEEVNATHGPFMSATLRHARARWRFRPATVDGKPVESWKRMTVTFTLDDA